MHQKLNSKNWTAIIWWGGGGGREGFNGHSISCGACGQRMCNNCYKNFSNKNLFYKTFIARSFYQEQCRNIDFHDTKCKGPPLNYVTKNYHIFVKLCHKNMIIFWYLFMSPVSQVFHIVVTVKTGLKTQLKNQSFIAKCGTKWTPMLPNR